MKFTEERPKKKTVVITGAGSGLGACLAERFSELGWHVCLLGRTKERLEITMASMPSGCSVHEVDVSSKVAVRAVMEKILDKRGSIECLVNNAGVGMFRPFDELTDSELDEMIDTNLKGSIYCTHEVIGSMRKRNSGTILNIISASGKVAKETETVYSASKFGVRGFAEALREELKGTDVHVLSVYMGNMKTDLWRNEPGEIDSSEFLEPGDVADLIMANLAGFKGIPPSELTL